MIYITGDTHGEFKHRFNTENFPEQKSMTKDDYVIICGDFGGIWERLERSYIPYRINHVSWWERELASEEELEEGMINLRKNENAVDFIISHCCSSSTQNLIGGELYNPNVTTKFLEYVKNNVRYKKWFFGHYHDNRNVSEKEILVYEQMVRIS